LLLSAIFFARWHLLQTLNCFSVSNKIKTALAFGQKVQKGKKGNSDDPFPFFGVDSEEFFNEQGKICGTLRNLRLFLASAFFSSAKKTQNKSKD